MVDERQLFHGTSASFVDAICQQNFDWRVCGLHGTSYGKGKGEGGPTGRTWLYLPPIPGARVAILKPIDGGHGRARVS